jgi:hypothetical protein
MQVLEPCSDGPEPVHYYVYANMLGLTDVCIVINDAHDTLHTCLVSKRT